MDWMMMPPTVSKFSLLGSMEGDVYEISDEAYVILEEMYKNLCCEDQTLRTYRRSIGFGEYITKNLIPLLTFAKEERVIDITIRLLANLTLPIECLYSVNIMQRTEVGRNTISDLNVLLTGCKKAFCDIRAMRAITDHLKSILEKDSRLSFEQCDKVNNCLLLLRNILHISIEHNAMQNQISWNLFTLSIDKLLLYLMSCPQRSFFAISIVQFIALIYKDQHISTLQRLLNNWFDASLSDSSEDESNTTPLKEDCNDSSPMLTSDSNSDNGGSAKVEANNANTERRLSATKECIQKSQEKNQMKNVSKPLIQTISEKSIQKNKNTFSTPTTTAKTTTDVTKNSIDASPKISANNSKSKLPKQLSQSDVSDCGYGTQVENPESISTSSNEDDNPRRHQKPPTNQKQRYNAVNNPRSAITIHDKKEWRRKKLVKRSKNCLINMKGLLHKTPSDEAISNILKEFTVDFLLKGYGYLVKELHAQLLLQTELNSIKIDTSHFFWLITYFLKFAAQLELDLEHIKYVLSFDIISYLTFEAVILVEEFELLMRQGVNDYKPCLQKMHLVITAIKEFIQTVDLYKKITHLSQEDKKHIHQLTLLIGETTDLHCLFVLMLRRYNPNIQSKQYLQNLIVTNHMLLILLDDVCKLPDYTGNMKMVQHIEQFATAEVMHQYGLLLCDFQKNGEYVNDCVFTMMHHVSGDIEKVIVLFQPIILKTFSQIVDTEYDLRDDWSDLIEYVMHKFINAPQNMSSFDNKKALSSENDDSLLITNEENECTIWSKEETDTLYWYYIQSKKSEDVIGSIIKLFNDDFPVKSRIAVIQQLLQQDIITLLEYDVLMRYEDVKYVRNFRRPSISSSTESGICMKSPSISNEKFPVDDVQILKERIIKEDKGKLLLWLQKVLVDCCYVKLNICNKSAIHQNDVKSFMEPIAYHCILKQQPIPIVPWNLKQNCILTYQPLMLLLHKLGFHLPVDAGKVYVRIPECWSANIMYNTAEKLGSIDRSILKFDLSLLSGQHNSTHNSNENLNQEDMISMYGMSRKNSLITLTPEPLHHLLSKWPEVILRRKSETIVFESTSPPIMKETNNNNSDLLITVCTQSTTVKTTTITTTATTITTSSLLSKSTGATPPASPTLTKPPKNDSKCGLGSRKTSIVPTELMKEHILEEDENDNELPNEDQSICETASVASDLTNMYDLYVSGDEDH